MPDHDRCDIRRNRRAKWNELDSLETLGRDIEHWQRTMRVDVRVAVTGKMFRRRHNMLALHSADERSDVAADVLRIFAETPRVDDRVIRIDVDVRDRRKDLSDTHRPRLPRHHPPFALCE